MNSALFRSRWVSLLCGLLLGLLPVLSLNCRFWEASPVVYKRYALYNLEEEGYLARDLVQTKATAESTADSGKLQRDRICASKALEKAQFRMARIFLHTSLEIPPVPVTGNRASFDQDYPVRFSDRDLFLATIDFAPILQKGYIALQDTSDGNACTVIFRIKQTDLIDEVESIRLSFEPESYEPGFRRQPSTIEQTDSDPSTLLP